MKNAKILSAIMAVMIICSSLVCVSAADVNDDIPIAERTVEQWNSYWNSVDWTSVNLTTLMMYDDYCDRGLIPQFDCWFAWVLYGAYSSEGTDLPNDKILVDAMRDMKIDVADLRSRFDFHGFISNSGLSFKNDCGVYADEIKTIFDNADTECAIEVLDFDYNVRSGALNMTIRTNPEKEGNVCLMINDAESGEILGITYLCDSRTGYVPDDPANAEGGIILPGGEIYWPDPDVITPEIFEQIHTVSGKTRLPDYFDPTKCSVSLFIVSDEGQDDIPAEFTSADEVLSYMVPLSSDAPKDINFTDLHRRFVKIGDVDCNGDVNSEDVNWILRYLVKWNQKIDDVAADVNKDGAVNSSDAVYLLRVLADWDIES